MKEVIKQLMKKIFWFCESRVAPWIAKYLRFLYWPIAKYCEYRKIVFVVNIASSTGHITSELDYFFRFLQMSQSQNLNRYIWVRKSDRFSVTCAQFYGDNFYKVYCSYIIYLFFLPLLMSYRKITIDFGLSRLKWQLKDNKSYVPPLFGENYLYQIPKHKNFESWKNYYLARKKTSSSYPLATRVQESDSALYSFLEKKKKVALIHIKDSVCNATASQTDPSTYLETLDYLHTLGYQLVFFGREKMPELFNEFSIFNYTESPLATFRNDILLTSMCDIAICGGSGIAFLPDCLGKYYLILNSWHLPLIQPSGKCIYIPSLVADKQGNKLSFAEQFHLYSNAEDKGAEIFPFDEFTPRNASSDEILEGIKELIMLSQKQSPWTENQIRFRNIGFPYPSYYAESRVSEYFLQKHSDRF